MSSHPTRPTFAGWYPDPDTGGTKYWDGSRWTGDTRPRRRPFAPAAAHRDVGFGLAGLGALFVVMSLFASRLNDGSVSTVGLFLVLFLVGAAAIAAGVYLLRGRGPTTEAVEARLAEAHRVAKKKRRAANLSGLATAVFGGRVRRDAAPGPDAVEAARISAIADPEAAQALQNLQDLLYTRAISDEEYQAAKDRLLGARALPDSVTQIEKLAELHQNGILGDIEFTAAKSRALRLS